MDSLSGKSIKKNRKSSHESLTLTCCHLSNLTLMKNDTTDQLHIIMDHIPGHLVTTGHPMVLPKCIIPFDAHKLLGCTKVTVELSRLYFDDRIFLETACCGLHDCKCLRKNLVKNLLDCLINFLYQFVRLCSKGLFLMEWNLLLKLRLYLSNTVLVFCYCCLNLILECLASFSELIIREHIDASVCFKDLLQCRPDSLHITIGLCTENLFKKVCK